ncbi:hypothetical protein M378DRAFT_12985 [Amanita muscaria Koide BX008]|uniref:Uncharacterized protein n=1 Tax=Amanita muscaria (strain Koide BX008) TaxID=946122 RepID=A0A0C2WZI9_AMAMK|nr:hypothetical protein M378DRAFT_12985 [Amanita muscaria Koide BX008]
MFITVKWRLLFRFLQRPGGKICLVIDSAKNIQIPTILPNVAILHTASRAAAAVHNQTTNLTHSSAATGNTPLGPWNSTGSSSKGTRGAKQNHKCQRSRFYAGFNGPVRTVHRSTL